jgi:hypothetical protein
MSRTTLNIDDDALKAAREYARRRGQSLSDAVSELVIRATSIELETDEIEGFHVVRLRPDSRKVTTAKVKDLEESIR